MNYNLQSVGGDTSQSISCVDCHAAGMAWGAPSDSQGFPLPSDSNPDGANYQIFSFLLFSATRSCPGDVDVNDMVDVNDFLMLIEQFGCTGDCIADANNDFVVDINDLLLMIGQWGSCPP